MYCGSGGQELCSEGRGCLFGQQFQNLLVVTRGEGDCQAEEGSLLGFVGRGSLPKQVTGGQEDFSQGCYKSKNSILGGHEEILSAGHKEVLASH